MVSAAASETAAKISNKARTIFFISSLLPGVNQRILDVGEIYEIKKLICQLEGMIKDTTMSSLEQTRLLFTGTAGVSPTSIKKFRIQALACVVMRQQPKGWTL